jgi:hypothetical protein
MVLRDGIECLRHDGAHPSHIDADRC